MLQFRSPLFPFTPILPPEEEYLLHHPILYDIHIINSEMTLSIWDRKKEVKSYRSTIDFFEQHIGMTSGYLRTATDRYNDTKEQQNKEGTIDFLTTTIHDVGEMIWRFIHHDQGSKDMWDILVSLVQDSQNSATILVRGDSIATWPVECLAESRADTLEESQRFSVVKWIWDKQHKQLDWFDSFQTILPKKIVMLAGSQSAQQDHLNLDEELGYLYGKLFPKDTGDEFKLFKLLGERDASLSMSPYELFYFPEGTNSEDIKRTINSITGPYIFMFSGHGLHVDYSTIDGQFYWVQTTDGKKTDYFTHDQMKEIFFDNPPLITIFNCCSTMRTADVRDYPENKLQPMEKFYQSIPFKGDKPFRVLFANRAATLDTSSLQISQSLADLIVNNGTVFDLLGSFSSIKLKNSGQEDKRLQALIKRDRAIGTVLII